MSSFLHELKHAMLGHQHSCGCESCSEYHHEHGEELDEHHIDRVTVVRLTLAAALFIAGLALESRPTLSLILMIASAVIAGYDIVIGAVASLFTAKVFNENLLMTVAALAAFLIGESHEGASVMLLFQIGELLQDYAVGRTRRSVEELMDLHPYDVTVLADGEEKTAHPDDLRVGDIILIRPGDKIPADCVVLEGSSAVNCVAITGDEQPVNVSAEDTLLSGYVNLTNPLRAEVSAIAKESTAARILELVRTESEKKGRTEKFISKFARIYTPIVLALAVIVVFALPLIFKYSWIDSIKRALVFLVIACPCALVISVPLAYFAGIGGASRLGILFKNTGSIDAVAKTKAVVFDRTGTLTTGNLRITSIKSDRLDVSIMLKMAAHAEAYSVHPIAKSIKEAYDGEIYIELITQYEEYPGQGISVKVDNIPVSLGSRAFIEGLGTKITDEETPDISVYISVNGEYGGRILLSDTIRDDSEEAVRCIEDIGGRYIAMVSADNREISKRFADRLGIEEFYADCLPSDKVAHVTHLKGLLGSSGSLIFVGDGVDSSQVFSAADAGVTIGGLGSDAAIEAADVIIMDDKPSKVATAVRSARNTYGIVWQNIIFALGIKLAILILGLFGISALWFAVFADVGVALLAVLNSMRAFHIRQAEPKTK